MSRIKKDSIIFCFFLFYGTYIFFIEHTKILLQIALFNFIIMLYYRLSIKKAMKSMYRFLPFILFTSIINYVVMNLYDAVTVGVKLVLVSNITYIFSNIITPIRFSYVIQTLLSPLKIFKINSKDIGLMICISISFIPILKKEFNEYKMAVREKGAKMKVNTIKQIFKQFFILMFRKVNEIEFSLKEKAYEE